MMPHDTTIAFLLFALVAAVTPGPSNLMVLAAGAQGGLRGGLPCLAGVVAGMALLLAGAALGVGALLVAMPGWLALLRWGGAAWLLWLSWRIATAAPMAAATRGDAVGFWRAFAFQWVNPKSWIVGASAAATYGARAADDAGASAPWAHAAQLGVLFAVAALPSCWLWLAFGAVLQRWLTDARRAQLFNRAMAATLAASVLFVLV